MNITPPSNPYRQYLETSKAAKTKDDITPTETEDSSLEGIKNFACGLLGIDEPNNASAETQQASSEGDSLLYNAGQYVSAAASVASIISLFV